MIDPEDRDALRNAVGRLLAEPDLRTELGVRARQWVKEHGSIEHTVRSFVACYRALVSERDHPNRRA
ncbi:MAG: glycosyltransferase [Thermoplasmata archaeon]